MQLRYSVPVFVDANDALAPKLSFSLERASLQDGASVLMLRTSNGTDVHVQLSRVRLDWSDGHSSTVSDGLLGYALPCTARRWRVPDAPRRRDERDPACTPQWRTRRSTRQHRIALNTYASGALTISHP